LKKEILFKNIGFHLCSGCGVRMILLGYEKLKRKNKI
jgi:hypothetical protein